MNGESSDMDRKLSAYLDGSLPADEMEQVAEYIRTHPEAARSLEKMRKLDELARNKEPQFSEDILASIEKNVLDRIGSTAKVTDIAAASKTRSSTFWYRSAALAASVVFVFIVGRLALREAGESIWPELHQSQPAPTRPEKSPEQKELEDAAEPVPPSRSAEPAQVATEKAPPKQQPLSKSETALQEMPKPEEVREDVQQSQDVKNLPETESGGVSEEATEGIGMPAAVSNSNRGAAGGAEKPEVQSAVKSKGAEPKAVTSRFRKSEYIQGFRQVKDEKVTFEELQLRLDSLNQLTPDSTGTALAENMGLKVKTLYDLASFPEGKSYRADLSLHLDSLQALLDGLNEADRAALGANDYEAMIKECRRLLDSTDRK
jgi:hypothetical protein